MWRIIFTLMNDIYKQIFIENLIVAFFLKDYFFLIIKYYI